MPSQEDYLDKLLRNMEKSGEPEIEAESEGLDSDAAEFGIPQGTESEFLPENVEDLLEDAVSDLGEALGLEGDLDLNELLEQEMDSELGIDERPDPMDMEAAAVLEQILPEADLPETDDLLEDAVADLETVLEAENEMDYSDTNEQATAEGTDNSHFDWEEVDIEFEDSMNDAEEAIHSVQEKEYKIEQEPIEMMEEPELVEEPEMMEEPGLVEESEMMEEPGLVEEPEMMEEPGLIEEPAAIDEQGLAELSDTMDVAEAIELLDAMEEPEPMEISDTAPDLEAVSTMSEDEIEQFLSASAAESQLQTPVGQETAEELSDEDIDLRGLLGDTDDSDLMDIQDMLDKADNNEAVDEEIEALLQGEEMPDTPIEEGVMEIEDEKSKRAKDKKRQRQEKAAAKKAAKEAKAAAKAAAKEGRAMPAVSEETEENNNSDTLFDADLLDSIVTGANQAELEETKQQEKSDRGSDDGLEFDMDSLFGDGDDSSLGSDMEVLPDDAFPDFIGLKKEDSDLVLPDMENDGKKKKGLLARFFDMLTEEDEDEESGSLQLSDENKEILSDLDKEKTSGKKKKKKKIASDQGDEEDAEGGKGKKAKKPKKQKPEKPKKEKVPEPEPLIPEKKLTPKKVIPVLLVCVSLGILLVVFTNASVDYTDKKTAHDAYYEGDYQTCYENLFGKELNETEQIMFGTSESILRIRLWLREYEMFVEAEEEVEALDSLIQTVNDYPELYAYAVQFNAGEEVMAAYENILNILYAKYGLTEAQAQEIAAVRSNYTYTQMVVDIILGKPFGSWNEPEYTETEPEAAPLPDELPEEGELSEGSFINNQ